MKRNIAKHSGQEPNVVPKEVRKRPSIGLGDNVETEDLSGHVVTRASRQTEREDPFAVFAEWSGDADERAYAGL